MWNNVTLWSLFAPPLDVFETLSQIHSVSLQPAKARWGFWKGTTSATSTLKGGAFTTTRNTNMRQLLIRHDVLWIYNLPSLLISHFQSLQASLIREMSSLEEPAVFLKQRDYRESSVGINSQKLHILTSAFGSIFHRSQRCRLLKNKDENEQSRFEG